MRADRAVSEAAASVADGLAVDWRSTEARVAPEARSLIRQLRLVETISTLYRSLPPEPAGTWEPEAVIEPRGPRWGPLVLLHLIGEGTSCQVHRAWDTELHREVALKLFHDDGPGRPDAHTPVVEEARRLARVRHPHIVQVYGAEQHDGRVGLWMELVRGESLDEIVTLNRLGAREAAGIGLDLCSALAAVHGAGLLHRDLKAQNVMREEGGRTVLMDFGTGEELRHDSGTNRMVGTPLYLAPEIFRGEAASVRSDLYSLGVLLFYLVTGRFPVTAGSMAGLAEAHARRKSQRLRDLRPDLPESFVRVVERALDVDPLRRYASAGELEFALREVLDPVARTPAPVTVDRQRPRTSPRAWRFLAGAAALSLVLAGLIVWTRWSVMPPAIRSLAVLPLDDLSVSPSPHLADGLTDQLISTLGQIQSLRVTSRTSVMRFKGARPPLAEIANALGVDGVVEGTLTLSRGESGTPDMVRVNVRLIAAGTDTQIWSESFERAMGDALALQADVARAIAAALNARVTAREANRLQQFRRSNPAAEEAYLEGRLHIDGYGAGRADLALQAFQRAAKLDPEHAAAHAGAALAYVSLGLNGAMSQPAARASALAEVRKALQLDDQLPEAYATLAHLKFVYDWDWSGAERDFRRSLTINPSSIYARTYYAEHLAARGRFNEAVAESRLAEQLDPQSGAAARRHALILYYSRDFDGAERAIHEALALEPSSAGGFVLLGRIEEARGLLEEALDATSRAAELSSGGGVPLRVQVIRLQILSDRHEEARASLDALERDAAERRVIVSARDLAYVHLASGRHSAAIEAFEQALNQNDPSLVWLAVDPRVDPLRHDARFQAILRSIGLS